MGEAKLRECPFCGGEAETDSYEVLFSHRIQNYIRCSKCYCMLEIGENATPSELIEHWNTRYEPPTPGGAIVPAGNERLVKKVK